MSHKVDFTFFYDPGHGWLRVSIADLEAVNLPLSAISKYSYRDRSGNLYLEEDCDCQKFIDRYQARFDHSPHITESNDGAFIRNLNRVHEIRS